MKNREKINSMTDKQLAEELCTLVETIATNAEVVFCCDICPVKKNCEDGCNGFQKFLALETEPNTLS